MNQPITIKAPGRVCLFGDHQDYLELPVIACAINRSLVISSEENSSNTFHFFMPDINEERIIDVDQLFDTLEKGDHIAAAMKVVRRYGCHPNKGYNIFLKSNIPINAGTSSSSAIVVGWIHFLLATFGCNQQITQAFIAQLAYEAEVVEHNSPGGKMDQYSIALGNIIYLDTRKDFSVTSLGTHMDGLVLGVSGIPKKTIGVLGDLRKKAQDAIDAVQRQVSNFQLKNTRLDEVEKFSKYIPKELQTYFYAAVKNHSITQAALNEFKNEQLDLKEIGRLMTAHHLVLKDNLGITVPKIDAMIAAAIEAGAYGAKIVGSGGGGSIVAIAPSKEKTQVIIEAIKAAGAEDAYAVSVTPGTQVI